MAEQTFRSPGFFEQEIDLSQRQASPLGTPAGVIGTAEKGPAFVPVTVGSFADFETKFGTLHPDRFGPYAVNEYLKYREAVTYTRVLGAGSNSSNSDISNTRTYGYVKNAGFKLVSSRSDDAVAGLIDQGMVQFITALHYVSASQEGVGYPSFTDNVSYPSLATRPTKFGGARNINLVRGVILTSTGSRALVADHNQTINTSWLRANTAAGAAARITATQFRNSGGEEATGNPKYQTFKLVISSSAGQRWGYDDNVAGLRIYTASLNPANKHYIANVLNADPDLFQEAQHLLWQDFAVEDELAPVSHLTKSIGLFSGSTKINNVGAGDKWMDSFGRFDTRYTTPRTTSFISQPFGTQEFELFHFETIDDGAYANDKVKISISNLVASTDPNYEYGTFNVEVRVLTDTDLGREVLEVFPNCSLDPKSDRFIAKQVGDKKVYYDFDSEDPDDRRIVIEGLYPNKSARIRVIVDDDVYNQRIPKTCLPFGFTGVPTLKFSDSLTDTGQKIRALGIDVDNASDQAFNRRIEQGIGTGVRAPSLTGSIVPPLPFRFKVTRGKVKQTSTKYKGDIGKSERVDSRLYWGVKTTRLQLTSSLHTNGSVNPALDANAGSTFNRIIGAYSKFTGIEKLDNLVTGSGKDYFNNNKFSLAKVALLDNTVVALSSSAAEAMKRSAYFRDAIPDGTTYKVYDPSYGTDRITLASLVQSSSIKFNRFSDYAKFTNIFYGGWDGLNILDKDVRLMRDKAASTDAGGKGGDTITGGLGLANTSNGGMMGAGSQNNVIAAYRKAVQIMTDNTIVNTNLLSIPGIRDPFVTDLALRLNKEYAMSMYVMDIQHYDEDENRLFDGGTAKPDARETGEQFESRTVDNNYAATYFPDVYINDAVNNRSVKVPSSVAALSALAYNDSVAYPWFAPAGFNRGSLGSVVNTQVRLSTSDRDNLYDARINPIANFPTGGFVIFGQKTLQQAKSALDRVNVRRMLLEVKRLVVQIADKLLFEPNNSKTRDRFVGQVAPLLALIQTQQGIEKFKVICDSTNNSQEDVDQNRLNGKIVVVPTRSIEFIAIDFIVTNSGVLFE